jgi:hypothetical protein
MAAALNWIIKDGLGQLGGVVYASFVSDKFDSEPKRFRFQATVAMQGANVLELLTPLWPGYFLIIASISNIGRTFCTTKEHHLPLSFFQVTHRCGFVPDRQEYGMVSQLRHAGTDEQDVCTPRQVRSNSPN